MGDKYVYPYEVIGRVLRRHVDDVKNRQATAIKAKTDNQNDWRHIIKGALHAKLGPGKEVFEVHYSGETALGIMTKHSPISFFVTYNNFITNYNEIVRTVGFDINSKEDSQRISEVIKSHIEALILRNAPADAKDRAAVTASPDLRDNIVSFTIRNVPAVPPGKEIKDSYISDDDTCSSGTESGESPTGTRGGFEGYVSKKASSEGVRRISLRIVLPTVLGKAAHEDTDTICKAFGSYPFLTESLHGAILWATAQKFYLDDESFLKLFRTKTETVTREPEARDLFTRSFGLMSLASIFIRATEIEDLTEVAGMRADNTKIDDANCDVSEDARVGRYFISLIRMLSSSDYFTLGTAPDSTAKNNKFPIKVPTLDEGDNLKYKLSAATISGDREDCRIQYNFTKDVASRTNECLGHSLSDQPADIVKRYTGKIDAFVEAVIFGVLRKDDRGGFFDLLREVRYCKRCQYCGSRDVRNGKDKLDICTDCKLAEMKEREEKRSYDNSWAGVANKAQESVNNNSLNAHDLPARGAQRGRGRGSNVEVVAVSRGRGRGNAAPIITETSAPQVVGSRGRGRGRGGSTPLLVEEQADPNINHDGVCFGCDRERSYLKGKPLKELCANCV